MSIQASDTDGTGRGDGPDRHDAESKHITSPHVTPLEGTRRPSGPLDLDASQHVHVVLLGLMGAGKSSAGRLVANELGRPFVDSDSLVELRSGRSPNELASAEGINALHRLEAAEANRVLSSHDAVVFAAAASASDILTPELLAPAWAVWLDASPEVLVERTTRDRAKRDEHHQRPLLGHGDPATTLADQHRARSEHGRRLADLVIDTDDLSAADVAARICNAWRDHEYAITASRRRPGPPPPGARGH